MRSNISLNVEFLAGTSITEAIKEASELARKLNLAYANFNFNGVKCSISQNPNIEKLEITFQEVIKTQGYLIG